MSTKRLGFSVVTLHVLIRAYIIIHLFNQACTSLDENVFLCFCYKCPIMRIMWSTRNRVCFFFWGDIPIRYTVTISRPSISIGGQMTSSLCWRRRIKERPYRCIITAVFCKPCKYWAKYIILRRYVYSFSRTCTIINNASVRQWILVPISCLNIHYFALALSSVPSVLF